MCTAEIVLKNEAGLHARPASVLVKMATGFNCNINLIKNGRKCNAKSIINILSLGAKCGEALFIETEGEDEKEALEALVELANNNFGE
ncbi:HPr family phosphocarrier protein [Crassaminicella profunda]|uniref:HPr family phosphocarrier protein n=1 Tax=Crassaminicella profunda TaxID=1286698 RepID=UPI001CA6D2B7|nr:HPr family phosphocarrier protein [Crassaminicella profunda]QZY55231.1 HPr family phosphocarrier protein [Crassaminicella profunda]